MEIFVSGCFQFILLISYSRTDFFSLFDALFDNSLDFFKSFFIFIRFFIFIMLIFFRCDSSRLRRLRTRQQTAPEAQFPVVRNSEH